jgi:DNA ligase (NAD+)
MDYKTLKQQIRYHNKLYYTSSKPEISDAEYDLLYDQLVELEKIQGYRDYDSPTIFVGAPPPENAAKIKHPYKLYSLQKTYDKAEVPAGFTIETPKLDGACVAIHCRNGDVWSVATRGDGEYGEDITHLFKQYLQDFDMSTEDSLGLVTVICEAVTFQTVDNYRNYVSGALGLKSRQEFDSRKIELVVHDVIGIDLDYEQRLAIVGRWLKTVVHNKEELKAIPQDGVVYRASKKEDEERLGYTSKYPKFAIALKIRATETAQTILKDVIWSIGRTGMVNPTGLVDPVIIGGATVSRLTLHNIAFIESNDICIGDKIEIERAGEIIPTYVQTIEKSPVRQPITAQNAEEGIETKVIRVGPRLFVADKSVNDERVLLHFVTQMNIQGLGPASIKKMGLTHISDLYKPQPWDSLGANGKKIAQEIEYSKTKAYEYVLAGLGIPSVGHSLARKIIQVIPKFGDLHKIEFEKIDKIGPKITEKILTWLDENQDWVMKLPVQLEQHIQESIVKRPICITGTLDRPRKELASILEEKGFEVKSSVTKKTYALITDGKIDSDKTETAKKYGIKIINYFDHKVQVLEGNF